VFRRKRPSRLEMGFRRCNYSLRWTQPDPAAGSSAWLTFALAAKCAVRCPGGDGWPRWRCCCRSGFGNRPVAVNGNSAADGVGIASAFQDVWLSLAGCGGGAAAKPSGSGSRRLARCAACSGWLIIRRARWSWSRSVMRVGDFRAANVGGGGFDRGRIRGGCQSMVVRSLRLTGAPLALAGQELALKAGDTTAEPSFVRATLADTAPVLSLNKLGNKVLTTLQETVKNSALVRWGVLVRGVLVVGWLYGFRARAANRLRWIFTVAFGVLLLAQAALDSGEGERWVSTWCAPLLMIFGAGFFFALLGSNPALAAWPRLTALALLALQALPLAHDALEPRRIHFQYPPYFPGLFSGMKNELTRRDAAWAFRSDGRRAGRGGLVWADARLGAAAQAARFLRHHLGTAHRRIATHAPDARPTVLQRAQCPLDVAGHAQCRAEPFWRVGRNLWRIADRPAPARVSARRTAELAENLYALPNPALPAAAPVKGACRRKTQSLRRGGDPVAQATLFRPRPNAFVMNYSRAFGLVVLAAFSHVAAHAGHAPVPPPAESGKELNITSPAGASYDSNIFGAATNAIDSLVYRLAPKVADEASLNDQTFASASYQLNADYFDSRPGEKELFGHELTARLAHAFSPVTNADITDSFSVVKNPEALLAGIPLNTEQSYQRNQIDGRFTTSPIQKAGITVKARSIFYDYEANSLGRGSWMHGASLVRPLGRLRPAARNGDRRRSPGHQAGKPTKNQPK